MADGHPILGDSTNETMTFRNTHEASNSALVQALFKVTGVQEVMLANRHVTVTRVSHADWDEGLREEVEASFGEFLQMGGEVVQPELLEELTPQACFEEGSIEARIAEILEDRVRPFVQQDGGDVAFDRFDAHDGTLYLKMQGSCAGCSQSQATLQVGVKNLMDHYVPEVKLIVGLSEIEEEDLPRPGR
jgi:Fe-S cluster biogenesis protein NfuA